MTARAIVLPATSADVMHVCRHMRAVDRTEAWETRWPGLDGEPDPDALAADLIAARPYALMMNAVFPMIGGYHDGQPAALLGAVEIWPRVVQVMMLATDDWPKVARGTFRHVRDRMIPALRAHGAIRAQCFVMEAHGEACRFVEHLGAELDARLEHYGRSGAAFRLYRWRR